MRQFLLVSLYMHTLKIEDIHVKLLATVVVVVLLKIVPAHFSFLLSSLI